MKFIGKRAATGIVAGLSLMVLAGCSTQYTNPDMIALRYSGGLTEGGKFKECSEPGNKQVSNDTFYPYPTTQRENVWSSEAFVADSNGDGVPEGSADHKDMQVIDKDGNIAFVKMKVQFYLNTECDTLRSFHEKIGRTRKAYFDADGSYGTGWLWAMDNYISSPVINLTKAEAVKYTVDEMWLNPAVRDEMAAAIEPKIQDKVNAATEGEEQYYQNFAVLIYDVKPSDEFQKLYQDRKAAATRAETAELNKKAKVAEAEANAAVAAADAKVKRATINGYPSVEAYLREKAIEQGMNPFQPTYVYPGSTPAPTN